MSLAPGSRLGSYEVTAKLGEGGMGEVWRATDSKLGREVALKLLPDGFADDPERHARFEREARTLASLNHPNIASLHALEHIDGQHALVMELVEGEGLDQRIARGPIPLEEALPIARQIAEALEAAHDAGVVHRDLKPANIRIRPDGTVKVLDFGLAKAWAEDVGGRDLSISPTITSTNTKEGVILGTAAYMSPEQARGRPVDRRADIWAFGVVLYEMLTGLQMFAGETVSDVLAGVLRADIDWTALPTSIPPPLRRLLGRCLTRNVRERLQAIGEARIALEGGAARDEEAPIAWRTVPSPRRSLWRAAAAVAALGLLVAAYLVGLGRSRDTESSQLTFSQRTFRRQAIFNARFAPDGKTLVYSAAQQGNIPQLFVVRPEYPEPQPLGLPDTHLLSVSSQGELAVVSHARWLNHRLFEGTLGRVPLGGGAPRDLMDHVRDADWSPDGAQLAIIHDVAGKDRLELPIGNVLCESPGYLSDPRVSPDGKMVAFFEHPVRYDDRGSVNVVDRSGQRRVLSSGYQALEGLAWLPGAKGLLFSAVDRGGFFHMTQVDLAGHARPSLPTPGSVTVQDVTPDGKWLFTRDDLPTQVMARLPGAREPRDYSWLDHSLHPRLSRDGRFMTLNDESSTGGVNYTVLLRRTDESAFVRLGEGTAEALSPDGRWILVNVPSTPQKLMLYPTGTGEPRRVDRGGIEAYGDIDWFPDGKNCLVSGNEPGKAPRCYRMSLENASLRPLTPEGTSAGLVSPDGRWVCARNSDGLYSIYPSDGGQPRDVPSLTSDDRVVRWSPDGRALWIFSTGGFPLRIDSVDLATGRRAVLETIDLQDRDGVVSVLSVSLADDPRTYAYAIWHYVSHLFVAEKEP